jgi:hypothetical protein
MAIFGQSTAAPRTVRQGHADSPLGACGWLMCGQSYCSAEFLCPLLLEFCFRFGIVCGLFLGLVGPL